MQAILKLPIKQIVFLLLTSLSGHLLADSSRLSTIRPRTVVYLYNTTNQPLKSRFTFEALDGKPVDNAAHYPNFNDIIQTVPVDMKNGMTVIAELARNRGIESNRTYVFTETLDLPGIGPVLELKQHLVGNQRSLLNPLAFGSVIKAGFAAPSLGIEPQYFDDQAWHRLIIPDNKGNWVLDFCFYGAKIWSDLKSQLEEEKRTALSGKTSFLSEENRNALMATGTILVGTLATAAIAKSAIETESVSADRDFRKHNIVMDALSRKLYSPGTSLEERQRLVQEMARNDSAFRIKHPNYNSWDPTQQQQINAYYETSSTIDKVADNVLFAAPIAIELSKEITSIRDNLLYKIEFIPKQQLSE